MTAKELYENRSKDELLSLFIHKWAGRGFIAWVVSTFLFRFTPLEFTLAALITFVFIAAAVRSEWKQYQRWVNMTDDTNIRG